ncbi:2OG-Fe(II) oxygenase [Hahella sp. CR1]|uniref:2OG-Fe(II) oxygenase n=1 Tax=Hahella sp. CR1 TaxID=2992807 RepID=UPI00244308A3|nr:2OG-Fe(II) oxygenase [Hahella sp. CR1]MDG9672122.1 2OG-Fe(II) oxygenase [Hahella sp. CR1]
MSLNQDIAQSGASVCVLPSQEWHERMADVLAQQGWGVFDDLIPLELASRLRQEAEFMYTEGGFSPAHIGRAEDRQLNDSVRRDWSCWLDGRSETQQEFLLFLENVRQVLNRTLYLGLQEVEAHYAVYEPQAYYRRHVDNFRGRSPRKVTLVHYLNQDWLPDEGGELGLYDGGNGGLIADITPEMGRTVIFLSEDFPHEVRLTHRARWSIACWLRTNSSPF